MELEFIAGMIAGEGSFTVQLSESSGSKYNIDFSPRFCMRLNNRDRELLESISDDLNGGTIHEDNDTDAAYFIISGWERCGELINKLGNIDSDTWEKSEKYRVFKAWASFVKDHPKAESWEDIFEIIDFAKSLNDGGYDGIAAEEWKKKAWNGC